MSGVTRLGAVAALVAATLAGPSIADERPAAVADPQRAARVLAFGHSYVAGLGASRPERAWPAAVADATCRTLVNHAGSGDISAETENRVLLAEDTIRRSDVAVVETGINDVRLFGPDADLLNRYGRHLTELLDHLQARRDVPIPVVVVADPGIAASAWDDYPPYNKGSQELADAYAAKLAEVAEQFPNVTVVDVRSGWSAEHIHPDGVHPNDAGHALIADAVRSVLHDRALSRCRPVTGIDITGPDVIVEPYGATQFTAEFTPANSWQQAMWSVTEPDGSPTDKATIDDEGVLRVKHRDGTVVVTATAVDGSGTTASKTVRLDLDPALLRGNAMTWPTATIEVSSEYSAGFDKERLRDGTQAQPGEWASAGEQNPWLEITWAQPIEVDRIVVYDRAGIDDANGGTLTFDDGSTIDVDAIPANGDPRTVTFEPRRVTSVRFQIVGGSGPNVGLAEFEVYAKPAAPQAPRDVTADAGDGSATVSWAPPSFDGGAPVIEYAVTPYRDGTALAPVTVDGDRTEAVVPGLTTGEPYAFTVTARNLMGPGPESRPSNEVRPR